MKENLAAARKSVSLLAVAILACAALSGGCALMITNANSVGSRVTHSELLEKEIPLQPGGSVSVKNHNGAISVSAWEKPVVRMKAEKSMRVHERGSFIFPFGRRRPFKTEEEADNYFQEFKVNITEGENTVEIETIYPEPRNNVSLCVKYELFVPEEVRITSRTHNGNVSVVGVQGTVKTTSHNGAISCARISGDVHARTHNGGVSVTEVRGDVNADTHNGSTTCKDISGNVEATTHNRDVLLRNIEGNAKAITHNGSISCANVAGNVEARTHNGSVEVVRREELSESVSISCRTHNGRIKLALPEGSSFDLVASTRHDRIKVSDEFPVTVTGDFSRRGIHGKVREGGAKVKLTTSNGSISIREVGEL
jgi:hypothetical protein